MDFQTTTLLVIVGVLAVSLFWLNMKIRKDRNG